MTNEEKYLARIAGENVETPEPVLRKEQYLNYIAKEIGEIPELPVTREERYLAILAGQEYEIPAPELRIEQYMAKACGLEIEVPTPITRVEQYWNEIAETTEITGTLPLTFTSRAAGALKNYRIYGVAAGAGVQTENVLLMSDLLNAPSGRAPWSTTTSGHMLTLELKPNTTYTCFSNGNGSESGSAAANRSLFIYSGPENAIFKNHPASFVTGSDGLLYLALYIDRSNADQYLNGTAWAWIYEGEYISQLPFIPHGYKIPLSISDSTNTSNYDLFIGSTKLGAAEYIDFGDQKVYKDISGVLTPTDPPAPLPAIIAYEGENTLSSTETIGEVTIKGRIKETGDG